MILEYGSAESCADASFTALAPASARALRASKLPGSIAGPRDPRGILLEARFVLGKIQFVPLSRNDARVNRRQLTT